MILLLALLIATTPFEDARLKFEEGLRLLDAQNFAEAAKTFEESLAIRKSLPAYYNLALARQGMGEIKLALTALSDLILLANEQGAAEDAAEAERLLDELRKSLAQLTVVLLAPADRLLLDGEAVPIDSGPSLLLSVDPGDHILEAQREGWIADREQVTIAAGGSARVELEVVHPPPLVTATPASAPEESLLEKWWFWAAVAGVAAAGTAAVLVTARSEEPPSGGSLGFSVQALTR